MGLETGTYINDLVTTNPPGTDLESQGANHLRLIKSVLKNTFPNASVSYTFPLQIAQYGAISGGGDASAAFTAAVAAAASGQAIDLSNGTWLVNSSITQNAKLVWWTAQYNVSMTIGSMNNIFVGLQTTANNGIIQGSHSFEVGASTTGTTNEYGKTFSFHLQNTGAGNYEKGCIHVLTLTDAVESGADYKAGIGLSARSYISGTNPQGRAFATNFYALINTGGEGNCIGSEIDLWNTASVVKASFGASNIKVGLILSNQGTNDCTTAIQMSSGAGGARWYQGIEASEFSFKETDLPNSSFLRLINNWKVDPTGYTYVGKDATNLYAAGWELNPGGVGSLSRVGNSAEIDFFRTEASASGTTTFATIQAFGKNSAGSQKQWGQLYNIASNVTAGAEESQWSLYNMHGGAAGLVLEVDSGKVCPGIDNITTCGNPSFRWTVVYATTSTINTSDATQKANIEDIEEAVLRAWGRVRQQQYRWQDAVAAKGDAARTHIGWIAQQVEAAFVAEGLDPWKYAPICRDKVMAQVKATRKSKRQVVQVSIEEEYTYEEQGANVVRKLVTKEVERPTWIIKPLVDENGKPILHNVAVSDVDAQGNPKFDSDGKAIKHIEQRPMMHRMPVMEEFDEEFAEERETGELRYGLRYEQCLVLETAWLRSEVARLGSLITPS